MDLGSIFLILALAVLVSLFVSRPFFETASETGAPKQPETDTAASSAGAEPAAEGPGQTANGARRDHDRSALLAERERLITALQELDFDHDLGKIPAEDYPAERMALLEAGANVLRKLDELGARGDAAPVDEPSPASRLEIDELEDMIAAHRRTRQENTTGFCPRCGKPAQKSDRFCSRCGAEIHPAGSASV